LIRLEMRFHALRLETQYMIGMFIVNHFILYLHKDIYNLLWNFEFEKVQGFTAETRRKADA
jgi:hypothetical protein